MLTEKTKKELNSLKQLAEKQDNKINLSMILITLDNFKDELSEVIEYFEQNGIMIVNEDVEPDSDTPDDSSKVIPFDPSKIDIRMDKITISSIISRIINNELEFDSSFQRKAGLWNKKQKSQLIESIILKIPLPAFYFDASDDDKWQIIDGLQRIATIKEYVVDQSFALTGMEFLKDLNGSKFEQLPRALQRRIEETNLNAYLVNPSTPKNVKFNIFKRINTGGLVLTAQEIRNALYQGQASAFLLEMSQCEQFKKATDYSINPERMLDREFCLRFVSFTQIDFEKEYITLDDFLNKGMEFLSFASRDTMNKVYFEFEYVMRTIYELFGRFAFRRLNTEERRGPVNKSLFEAWSLVILKLNELEIEKLKEQKDVLKKSFIKLCDDYDFQNAIRASDKTSIKSRITRIQDIIYELIGKKVKNDQQS
ncbi:MAG: DUF262 domain-containing protein [Ruminococcus sp.]